MTATSSELAPNAPLIPAIPAFASIGVGRTRAYELLNSGKVPAVKVGRSTMIRSGDWQHYLDNLPTYGADEHKNREAA